MAVTAVASLPNAATCEAPDSGAAKRRSLRWRSVDAAVGKSLDALKGQLFRLELRQQAGTISEAEYARNARARKKCCATWCEAETSVARLIQVRG